MAPEGHLPGTQRAQPRSDCNTVGAAAQHTCVSVVNITKSIAVWTMPAAQTSGSKAAKLT
jgi:hypothetical protein